MIVANLATYPKRLEFMPRVVAAIAPQVDVLNVVLNEFDTVPESILGFSNVKAILPDHDTKDAGKFYPDVSGAEYLFYVDDDIIYPQDYVSASIRNMQALGEGKWLGGYHCSIYTRPGFSFSRPDFKQQLRALARFHLKPERIASFRTYLHFGVAHEQPIFVDQIGSGAAVMLARDAPTYDFMRSSQKFVDVRLARWCFERGIARVSLPRHGTWIQTSDAEGVSFEETIVGDFTMQHHGHVAREIRTFAFRDSRVGKMVRQGPGIQGNPD